MGCDIHAYLEVKKDGKWVTGDEWKPDKYEPKRLVVDYDERIYSGRNYYLFSILADVRNGRGFIPIAQPKGMPEDACPQVKKEAKGWGQDGHSHSHLTLQEILAYDWTQIATLVGQVEGRIYAEWMRWGRQHGESPSEYCGGCFGPRIRHMTDEDAGALVKGLQAEANSLKLTGTVYCDFIEKRMSDIYVSCEWQRPYSKCCENFWTQSIPRMLQMGKPEDVRMVFWFDN